MKKLLLSTKYEGSLNNYLSRLSNEYSMTYEYASENYHDEVDIEFARVMRLLHLEMKSVALRSC